jgi:iron complex transport system substrate-binding protein
MLIVCHGVLLTSCYGSTENLEEPGLPISLISEIKVTGIVDPNNDGWPRAVQGYNGQTLIEQKPQRIITASIGHDEVTYSLVESERVIGVGAISKDSTYSNVSDIVQNVTVISREPEILISENPDLIVTSIYFNAKQIAVLGELGIPVVQTELKSDPEGQIQNILLMGYIYGEERRAEQLASEVRLRYEHLRQVTSGLPDSVRPLVLAIASFSNQFYGAGKGSTEGGIIEVAGGINTAEIAGLKGNPAIGLESIVAMMPEVILITQPPNSGNIVRDELLSEAALSEVPAVENGNIYIVEPKYFTTLSFWNILGAEILSRILWPVEAKGINSDPFSRP